MQPPLSTNKQKYYHPPSLVCEDLHTLAIDTLGCNDHEASTATLTAVQAAGD